MSDDKIQYVTVANGETPCGTIRLGNLEMEMSKNDFLRLVAILEQSLYVDISGKETIDHSIETMKAFGASEEALGWHIQQSELLKKSISDKKRVIKRYKEVLENV